MKALDEPYQLIICGAPAVLSEVRLREVTWQHIRTDHSDVPYLAIVEAIEDPCFVCQSKTRSDSVVFINTFSVNRHGHPLRVPVAVEGSGVGRVSSAYFSASSTHGVVIWKR